MQFAQFKSLIIVLIGIAGLLAISNASLAVESGPDAGTAIPKLPLLVLLDDNTFSEQDVATDRKEKLSVYAFIQATEWSRPMARFVRGVDKALSEIGGNAHMTAIWLTADQEESKRYLPRGRDALKLKATTFAVHPGDKQGPKDWNVNSRAFITIVIARDAKTVKSFAFVSVNETDVPAVSKTLQPKDKP